MPSVGETVSRPYRGCPLKRFLIFRPDSEDNAPKANAFASVVLKYPHAQRIPASTQHHRWTTRNRVEGILYPLVDTVFFAPEGSWKAVNTCLKGTLKFWPEHAVDPNSTLPAACRLMYQPEVENTMNRVDVPNRTTEKLVLKKSDMNAVNLALSLADKGTGNLFPPYENYRYILNGSLTGISLFSVWKDNIPVLASFITWSDEGLEKLRPAVSKVYQRMIGPIRIEEETDPIDIELPQSLPQIVSIPCVDFATQDKDERKFLLEFEQTMAWAILVERRCLDANRSSGSLDLEDSTAAALAGAY